ncbi:MAG: low molecular weight protein-tyrosine-phosphatase [Burkholderiales bacterium]
MQRIRVLFVCTGNICRSPTAEAVFRRLIEAAGLADGVAVDSAGTHDFNLGSAPDARAQAAAEHRGYNMRGVRARQVTMNDFETFDLILAMDNGNLEILKKACFPECLHKLRLVTQFSSHYPCWDIPDPYSGDSLAFERVLDMLEDAVAGLVEHLSRQHQSRV